MRELARLVGAYIPNVNGRGLLAGGEYEGVLMVAAVRGRPDAPRVVVGGAVFKPHPRELSFIELALFAVENKCQGRGLGMKLMTFLKRFAKDTHGACAVLSYADFKAYSFFKRLGYDRRVTLAQSIWKPAIVHYEGAAVVEARLENLDAEEAKEKAAAEAPPASTVRVIACTSGQPNCYCKTGRTRAIARFDPATGQELQVYCSASDAARKHGLAPCAVTHVTNGLSPSAQGHHFRYVAEVPWLNSGARAVLHVRAPASNRPRSSRGRRSSLVVGPGLREAGARPSSSVLASERPADAAEMSTTAPHGRCATARPSRSTSRRWRRRSRFLARRRD